MNILNIFKVFLNKQNIDLKIISLNLTKPVIFYIKIKNTMIKRICSSLPYITPKNELHFQFFNDFIIFYYIDNFIFFAKKILKKDNKKFNNRLKIWFNSLNKDTKFITECNICYNKTCLNSLCYICNIHLCPECLEKCEICPICKNNLYQ